MFLVILAQYSSTDGYESVSVRGFLLLATAPWYQEKIEGLQWPPDLGEWPSSIWMRHPQQTTLINAIKSLCDIINIDIKS